MRCRKKADPSFVVSVMTHRELRRYGENCRGSRDEFFFHGLRVDAHRVFKHGDPMFVLYRDGVEVGQLGEHDKLVIEDGGAVYPVAHAQFEATYERDPDWTGGPPAQHRRSA